jgi:glycosyltransferase involved in cell wall biosynthesis
VRSRDLLVVGPLPPPYHGVTVSTSLVLANPYLLERFAVEHLDTSDPREIGNIGKWELTNILLGLRALTSLVSRLRGRQGILYLPLSQNAPAFLRDSLFIHTAALLGWKVAVHLRGSDFRTFYSESGVVLQHWIRMTLRRVQGVAVVGESLRWVFEGLVPPERISVVPNGTPDPRHDEVARDPEHVLFLSHLRRRKGVAQAVEAALLVLEARPTARFTFAGTWESPDLERELRRWCEQSDGRIEFRRAVHGSAKAALLGSAGIFLFPPVEPEGHPRVVLEAMAWGIPVVTTDRGAIKETVVDGRCGFVLDDPEPRLLADRVLVLLDNDALRADFGQAARRIYLDRFTQGRADAKLTDWLLSMA